VVDVDKAIRMAVRTGKVILGSKRTIQLVKHGKVKLAIVASNCPAEIKNDLEYYCKLSNVPVYIYDGTSWDLGAVCGKPFMVAAMAVVDPGDSEILKLVKGENNGVE